MAQEFNDNADGDVIRAILNAFAQEYNAHRDNLANPHQVTKTQVGLGNVDNTADVDKEPSNPVLALLAAKYDASNPNNYITIGQVVSAALGAGFASLTGVIDLNDTLLTAIGKLYGNNDLKRDIALDAVGSDTVAFVKERTYGSPSVPRTGNILLSTTGAQYGVCVMIIHNHSAAPTFPSEFKKLNSSQNYVTGVLNYIVCQYLSSTKIIYTISQES